MGHGIALHSSAQIFIALHSSGNVQYWCGCQRDTLASGPATKSYARFLSERNLMAETNFIFTLQLSTCFNVWRCPRSRTAGPPRHIQILRLWMGRIWWVPGSLRMFFFFFLSSNWFCHSTESVYTDILHLILYVYIYNTVYILLYYCGYTLCTLCVYHLLSWDDSMSKNNANITTIYHYIPLYTTIYHYIPLYTTIYHYIPLYTTIYHYIPLYTTIYHYIPLYTTIYHYGHYMQDWFLMNLHSASVASVVWRPHSCISWESCWTSGCHGNEGRCDPWDSWDPWDPWDSKSRPSGALFWAQAPAVRTCTRTVELSQKHGTVAQVLSTFSTFSTVGSDSWKSDRDSFFGLGRFDPLTRTCWALAMKPRPGNQGWGKDVIVIRCYKQLLTFRVFLPSFCRPGGGTRAERACHIAEWCTGVMWLFWSTGVVPIKLLPQLSSDWASHFPHTQ